jgi:hypothetical protein
MSLKILQVMILEKENEGDIAVILLGTWIIPLLP